jgi:hypothetical protein
MKMKMKMNKIQTGNIKNENMGNAFMAVTSKRTSISH